MQLFPWLHKRMTGQPQTRRASAQVSTPHVRPRLEALEDRTLLSTFFAATVSDLIQDIQTANQQGGANTIVLTAPTSSPYVMTKVDNSTDGPTVLPQITSGDDLTIRTGNGTPNPGYGDILDAGTDAVINHGRLFDVAQGGSLTLENVTLQNGRVSMLGAPAEGGAIYNQGTLVLNSVMVQNNATLGWPSGGHDAAGGGIWSKGSLTVENASVFQGNSASGSDDVGGPTNGGNAFGGAIYIAGGTANITDSFGAFNQTKGNAAKGSLGASGLHSGSGYGGAIYVAGGVVTLSSDTVGNPSGSAGRLSNTAHGPDGNSFGKGYGGGLYVAGGSVTLTNDTVSYNVAGGIHVGASQPGYGGGIFIAANAKVSLDAFTVAHTMSNRANSFPNIDGTYTLLT